MKIDNNPKIFIVGVGRSGTSLLQSMLASHPLISFPPETHFFRKYVAHPMHRSRLEKLGPQAFGGILRDDKSYARIKITSKNLLKPYVDDGVTFKLADVYIRLLSLYRDIHRKIIVGDKDPRNIDYILELSKLYPNAFILHIIRDPRDVYLSREKAKWSQQKNKYLNMMIYQAQIKFGSTTGNKIKCNCYFEIFYEQLITEPENTLKNICEFTGLTYSSNMLSFEKIAKNLVSEDELGWKSKLLGPILTNNKGKWKNRLKPSMIYSIEMLCGYTFSKYSRYYKRKYKSKIIKLEFEIVLMRMINIIFTQLYPIRKIFIDMMLTVKTYKYYLARSNINSN
jgi:hypothetical protein